MKIVRVRVALLTFLLAGLLVSRAFAATRIETSNQTELKAEFLLNVLNYVEWPAVSFEDQQAPIVIGVAGREHLASKLERLASGKIVNGRSVLVKRIQADSDLYNCHVVYLGLSNRERGIEFLRNIQHESILSVGEGKWLTSAGGIMDITLKNGRVYFEMNPSAAWRSGLHISSRLLSLATIVNEPPHKRQY